MNAIERQLYRRVAHRLLADTTHPDGQIDPAQIEQAAVIILLVTKNAKRAKEILTTKIHHDAWDRFIAMYLIRRETELSLPVIALMFGYRHHNPVLYGIRQVERFPGLHRLAIATQRQIERMKVAA